MQRRTFRRFSSDDWYPCFPDSLVEVSFMRLDRWDGKSYHTQEGPWRICVWGADDCGMEIDTEDRELAERIFEELKDSSNIKRSRLIQLGFVSA
jgi:hypothetical protein